MNLIFQQTWLAFESCSEISFSWCHSWLNAHCSNESDSHKFHSEILTESIDYFKLHEDDKLSCLVNQWSIAFHDTLNKKTDVETSNRNCWICSFLERN